MIKFNKWIIEAVERKAEKKTKDELQQMFDDVKNCFKKIVETSAKGPEFVRFDKVAVPTRHNQSLDTRQIRLMNCETDPKDDPIEVMERMNAALVRDMKGFVKSIIQDNDISASGDYTVWKFVFDTSDSIRKSASKLAKWYPHPEEICEKIAISQESHPKLTLQIVYAIPTKKRQGEENKSLMQNKIFTPQWFNLSGPYDLKGLVAAIQQTVDTTKTKYLKIFANYMMEITNSVASSAGGINIPKSDLTLDITQISQSDIDKINKNYGEVLCAMSVLKKNPQGTISFPSESNYAVADFILHLPSGESIKYSVKNSGKSKGTAISSSMPAMIKNYEECRLANAPMPIAYKRFKELMNILCRKDGTQANMVKAAKVMSTQGGIACASVLNAAANCVSALMPKGRMPHLQSYALLFWAVNTAQKLSIAQDEESKKRYNNFLDKMVTFTKSFVQVRKNPTALRKELEGSIKNGEYGIFIYPIGTSMLRDMNADTGLRDALNAVLNSVDSITQIETNITVGKDGSVAVHEPIHKKFKSANFHFDYNGLRKNEGNNRGMSYKMD